MCTGTLVRHEQTPRNEWPDQGGGHVECVRARQYTMSRRLKLS